MAQAPFMVKSPVDAVAVGQPQLDSFQAYQDAAMQQGMRHLQPQMDAQSRKFEQQMVNKGLTPGSKAYDLAMAQMQRGQNDLKSNVAFGAIGAGLQAQQQAFGQGLQASQLHQRQNQFNRNLGEQSRQFNANMSQRQSEFDRNYGLERDRFGLQTQQADFGNLMQLGNFAMGFGNQMNQNLLNEYNMGQTTLGGAPGFMGQQVNVGGAYNTAQNAQLGAAGIAQQQQNNVWGGIGQLAMGAAMLCGEQYKKFYGTTPQKHRAQIAAHICAMPIYDWDYLPEYREQNDEVRFGPTAEDFNRAIVGKEADTIDIQRYVGALHVTVQQLFSEVRRLEAMLYHAVNQSGVMFGDASPGEVEGGINDEYESIIKKAAKNHREYFSA